MTFQDTLKNVLEYGTGVYQKESNCVDTYIYDDGHREYSETYEVSSEDDYKKAESLILEINKKVANYRKKLLDELFQQFLY